MKFLVIRFSSIGDIVLTSPVLRCLKAQFSEALEIHYLTKKAYLDLVQYNPNVDQVHVLEDSTKDTIEELKKVNFDYIIDLHNNLRTIRVKKALGVKSYSFKKLNIEKWVLVNFKKNRLPEKHVVDRYLETLDDFGIQNDQKGLDFHFPDNYAFHFNDFPIPSEYVALVIGAKFNTKRFPKDKLLELCQQIDQPILLLGGPEEEEEGNEISQEFEHVHSLCGKINLLDSAYLLQKSKVVVCNDTGLMHIAAAFGCQIVSIWGNTVPDFGMYPYLPQNKFSIHEVDDLNCRPCSKIGYQECPKKHFNCMQEQSVPEIKEKVSEFWAKRSSQNSQLP